MWTGLGDTDVLHLRVLKSLLDVEEKKARTEWAVVATRLLSEVEMTGKLAPGCGTPEGRCRNFQLLTALASLRWLLSPCG